MSVGTLVTQLRQGWSDAHIASRGVAKAPLSKRDQNTLHGRLVNAINDPSREANLEEFLGRISGFGSEPVTMFYLIKSGENYLGLYEAGPDTARYHGRHFYEFKFGIVDAKTGSRTYVNL